MRLAGAIIALIAGIFATFAAGFTLFVGGVGGALGTDNASLVVALGWGGVAFSFATIVWGAIGVGNKTKTPGYLLIPSSIAGAILGGTFVAIFMVLALIGGILVAIGGSKASAKPSSRNAYATRVCAKCGSSITAGQAFCGGCGAAAASLDQEIFSARSEQTSVQTTVRDESVRASPKKESGGNNWLAWIGGAVLVGLFGLFGSLAVIAADRTAQSTAAGSQQGIATNNFSSASELVPAISSPQLPTGITPQTPPNVLESKSLGSCSFATKISSPEFSSEDISAMMCAIYPAGVSPQKALVGVLRLGNQIGVVVGTDSFDDCRACSGTLSAYYLAKTEAGFVVEANFADFARSGSDGRFNREARLLTVGGGYSKRLVGLSDADSGGGQGCFSGRVRVFLFSASGPYLALKAPMGFSFGDESVSAEIVDPVGHGADFAIRYTQVGSAGSEETFGLYFLGDGRSLLPYLEHPPLWATRQC